MNGADDSEAPHFLNLSPPNPLLLEAYPETYASKRDEQLDAINRDPAKVPILFDLRQPIEAQLAEAREMLRDNAEGLRLERASRPHFRPENHARQIRLLDAVAAGATLEEMAATLHPGEENDYPEYRVTKRLRKELKQAKRLRDEDYWRFPARSFVNAPA